MAEVTMKLTITGLYPADTDNYQLTDPAAMAALDAEQYASGEVSLEDLISWLDDTSDIRVTIEPEGVST
jgi:hypothetical protein